MKTFELTFTGGDSAIVTALNVREAMAQAGTRRVLCCVDLEALAEAMPKPQPERNISVQ